MYCAICFIHYPGSNHFWDVLSCCLKGNFDTFTKDFFPKLKNYEIKLKKERTSEQCPEFVNFFSKKVYTTGQNWFNDIIQ